MSKRRLFRWVLFGMLGVTVCAWGYTQWDAYRMRQSLTMVRDAKVLEFERHSRYLDRNGHQTFEVVGIVTAGREYGIVGRGIGKIILYTRVRAPLAEFGYGGVEFHYRLDEASGQWILSDSIAFRDFPARRRAEAEFISAGYNATR